MTLYSIQFTLLCDEIVRYRNLMNRIRIWCVCYTFECDKELQHILIEYSLL